MIKQSRYYNDFPFFHLYLVYFINREDDSLFYVECYKLDHKAFETNA